MGKETPYEQRLADIIKDYDSEVEEAISQLLTGLYEQFDQFKDYFEEPDEVKKMISFLNGKIRIKASALRDHAGKTIIARLAKNKHLGARASIVYKRLIGEYHGAKLLSSEEIEKHIKEIVEQGAYPSLSHIQYKGLEKDDSRDNYLMDKEGPEGKYKAASQVFTKSEPSHLNTIKLAVAVVGIKLDALERQCNLVKGEHPEPISPEPVAQKVKTKKTKTTSTISWLIAGLIILSVVSWRLITQYQGAHETLRSVLASSDVFQTPFQILAEDTVGIQLELIGTYYEQMFIGRDSVPANQLWVRLRLTNTLNVPFYPDALFIKQIHEEVLPKGNVVQVEKLTVPTASELMLPNRLNSVCEWRLTNDEKFTALRASQATFSLLKISSSKSREPTKITFELGVAGHTDEHGHIQKSLESGLQLVVGE